MFIVGLILFGWWSMGYTCINADGTRKVTQLAGLPKTSLQSSQKFTCEKNFAKVEQFFKR